ncbi:MAG: hypothetical protein ACRCV3_01785 [Desulfovibrionaceae bacterium]
MKYVFIILLCVTTISCGKSEMPRLVVPTNLFTIEKTEMLVYENCLIAKVFFSGAYTALYQVELELEERDSVSEDRECPIKPTIVERVSSSKLREMGEDNNFLLIQYCPKEVLKPYYRWRVKARHYLYKVSPEYSPIQTTTVVSE